MFCFDRIIEGVFLGDYIAASRKDDLKRLGITHVIIAAQELKILFPNDFRYLHLKVTDSIDQNISKFFASTRDFIDTALDNGGRVFVHCYKGISRSTSIVVAYLMSKQHLLYEQALAEVKKHHPEANPNPGFSFQLIAYERDLNQYSAPIRNQHHCRLCSIF